jgi:hypothetical protein
MSRNTVDRLLALREPPRYAWVATGSCLDPFIDRIAAMLAEDPTVRAAPQAADRVVRHPTVSSRRADAHTYPVCRCEISPETQAPRDCVGRRPRRLVEHELQQTAGSAD